MSTTSHDEFPSRAALRRAKRVCVKAGTSVVANEDGRPSLTRLGAIAEQIAELVHSGVEVIFVSSGAVGMGKRLLRKQSKMLMSFKDNIVSSQQDRSGNIDDDVMDLSNSRVSRIERDMSFVSLLDVNFSPHTSQQKKRHYDSACASAGQFEMMNLYQSLFAPCDVVASQLLVTQMDFIDPARLSNLKYATERLLSLGIVPIINENDAVSGNLGYTPDDVFSDNDSLAALCARNFGAEVLLLLTDVQGVFDRPPREPGANLLSFYDNSGTSVAIGEKSTQGRGGMAAKIDAALSAVQSGSPTSACIIAAGNDLNSIRAVFSSKGAKYGMKGTLFCQAGSRLEQQARKEVAEQALARNTAVSTTLNEAKMQALAARVQARKLQGMPYSVRQAIVLAIADALLERQDEILQANNKDSEQAEIDGTALALRKRLKLIPAKLSTLSSGLKQIAGMADPLGKLKSKREVAEGLELSQVTVPIGILMIIFESRPDSMPQISALALASGNGLLLKGGKEAANSNSIIHTIIGDAIEKGSNGLISREIIALLTTRDQIADMLALDDVIDLVIPRGSNALVSYIKANTRMPVLGHADGVCHVYVDATADTATSCKVVVDSKTDYPSACNAMETLLLHKDTIENGVAASVLMALRKEGVKCLGGPNAMKIGLCDSPALELKFEYGDLTCMVEVVDGVTEAIDWIHTYGSGHTEAIVCSNDSPAGEHFIQSVDSACVFKNASTRFADGYRFGLGAEVGISTGRIHARGPVGVEGLVSTKWQLRSSSGVYTVNEFAGNSPLKTYTHKDIL